MSAPVLTIKEQKASVSAKKKKKKTMKNVLGIPNSLKVESHCVELNEVRKLIKALERLLPTARLPLERDPKCNKNSNEPAIDNSQLRAEAKKKRNQLSLGVNALNRSIKQDLISGVLLANDIQPKFLIHHLNLLCNYNKIPFLQMPRLREITKNSLGFPCIAIGFKKDFCDFSEVVEELRLISQAKNIVSNDESKEPAVDSNKFDEDKGNNEDMINLVKVDEPPFEYLYRTSTKERIYVPEKNEQSKQKSETDFLVIKDKENEIKITSSLTNLGISSRFQVKNQNQVSRQKKRLKSFKKEKRMIGKEKKIEKLHNYDDGDDDDDDDEDDDDDDDDDEDLEVPKKKIKKDWFIDTVGTKQKINYFPANVINFSSNPDRNKRRNK